MYLFHILYNVVVKIIEFANDFRIIILYKRICERIYQNIKFLENSLHFRNIFINRIMHHLILFDIILLSLHGPICIKHIHIYIHTHKKKEKTI